MLTLMIIAAGAFALTYLKKETFPNIDFDMVIVSAAYPGSSAEDVETLVTIPLERQIKTVDGLEEINGISSEGLAIFYLKVDPDYETDDLLIDVRNAVESVEDLPDEVKTPRVTKAENKLNPVIKISLRGDTEQNLRVVSKRLRDILEKQSSVARVNLGGYRKETIVISLDPEKLSQYQLTVSEVAREVQRRNIKLSTGKIETEQKDFNLRVVGEFSHDKEIKNLIIRSNNTGRKVKISDIGKVEHTYDPNSTRYRIQGVPALFLNVLKKEKADVIKTVEAVREDIKEFFQREEYRHIKYTDYSNDYFYVKRRLGVLTQNGTQGIILVFICLLLFMNFRIALITSLGAPVAFMTAFALMDYFGVSVNLISMFGLIMVLGMLVDDSIIVAEQFYQNVELGMQPRDAARKAALQTLAPVTATIFTTLVAFGALLFMGGIMGKFLWSMPIVIIICLLASWFECFFILPNHLAEFIKIKGNNFTKERWYAPLVTGYAKFIKVCLRHYILSIISFIALFSGSLYTLKFMKFELFPSGLIDIVAVYAKAPVGTPVAVTEKDMTRIEEITLNYLKQEELDHLETTIGEKISEHGKRNGSHYGTMFMYLTPEDQRDRLASEIINDLNQTLSQKFPKYDLEIRTIDGGPPKGDPINVELLGDSLKNLQTAANQLKEFLQDIAGVTSVSSDYEQGKEQYLININDTEARRLGLSYQSIALAIRQAYVGDSTTKIVDTDEDLEIEVKLQKQDRTNLQSLKKLEILNDQGKRIRLDKVATFTKQPGAFIIRRFNRKRAISIKGQIDRKSTSVGEITRKLKPFLVKLAEADPEISYQFKGENKDTADSLENLKKAAIVAAFIVFIALIAMFNSVAQPLIIMSAIPLGMIGVIFTFKLLGLPISFMALLGIIGLIGVVVNDSIVLVNTINLRYQEASDSENHLELISEGATSRFRAVILTTFTTVVGLLPVAHAPGGDPFLKPMATSFAWGLLFSTSLTLVFVPSVYLAYRKILSRFKRAS